MARTNINVELFKRYAPKKKIEIIKNLTDEELSAVSTATITRVVKEAGRKMYKSRDKRLYISRDRQKGNNWNSVIEAVELIKGKLYLDAYLQADSTDRNTSVSYSDFMRGGEYRIKALFCNRYGDDEPYYFIYDNGDKLRVVRSILLEYVYSKYADKL